LVWDLFCKSHSYQFTNGGKSIMIWKHILINWILIHVIPIYIIISWAYQAIVKFSFCESENTCSLQCSHDTFPVRPTVVDNLKQLPMILLSRHSHSMLFPPILNRGYWRNDGQWLPRPVQKHGGSVLFFFESGFGRGQVGRMPMWRS
jgi:hypothetical protein